jgi:hypothetical protein
MEFMTDVRDGISIDSNGTSLRGEIRTTRAHLTEVFGEPHVWPEGDKVTLEWIIQFSDGTIATIYDWKRYELGTPDLHEVEDYHIGGNDFTASLLVKEAMEGKVM